MNRGNFFRRAVSMAFVAVILLINAVSHAEIYTAEGSYVMSEVENIKIAKERAKANAMRYACEQAGVYVKSYSLMKNFKLEADVIETMTANIIKLVEEPRFYPLEELANMGGVLIRVTIKAQIDDSDIMRWLNKGEQEKSELVAQNEALRKANAEQERQIAELKRQLATKPQDIEQIAKKFADEDKIFLSNQKVEEGWKLWEKKDFNGATKLFDEAIQLNPNNSEAWRGCGTALNDLGQRERAIQDLSKAIQLNPNYAIAYNNRGVSYADLGQYDRAIQDFDKALEFKEHELMYYNRGNTYYDLGQYERAIQDFNKAIKLNPNDFEAYNNRGVSYYDLGQYERAIQDFNKAIKLNPNDFEAYNNRGDAYFELKQYKQAVLDYNKAISLNPDDVKAYFGRGTAYFLLKQYKLAIPDFNKTIELNPNNAMYYENRGLAYHMLGKYEQAIKNYNKTIELNPNHASSYYFRGDCYRKLGKKTKAQSDFAKAKALGYNG